MYFEEMQVTLITQRQAYDQESLFGELYKATQPHEHVVLRHSQLPAHRSASLPAACLKMPGNLSVCWSVRPSVFLSVSVFSSSVCLRFSACFFEVAGFVYSLVYSFILLWIRCAKQGGFTLNHQKYSIFFDRN